MTVVAPVDAGGRPPPRSTMRWWPVVPVVPAVGGAAALLLTWWRADFGPVLLGSGPLRELSPDAWTGVEVAGMRTAVVAILAGAAVLAALLGLLRRGHAGDVVARAGARRPPSAWRATGSCGGSRPPASPSPLCARTAR